MIWWVSDPDRGLSERLEIARLEQSADWLQNVRWRLDGLKLLLDFEIVDAHSRWRLTMHYPEFFPSIPPLVFNADGERISGHQYGQSGELCLEYRPDNWEITCTGSMMIESAHRLLVGESGGSHGQEVISVHAVSEGQRLRGTYLRLVIPEEALRLMQLLEDDNQIPIEIEEHLYGEAAVAHLTAVGTSDKRMWQQGKPVSTSSNYKGTAIRVRRGLTFPGPANEETLAFILEAVCVVEEYPEWPPATYLLVDDATAWLAMAVRKAEGGVRVYGYATFVIGPDQQRLPVANSTLADKRIALIGCGSLGSRTAAMLVRSGARSLELFDDDILTPGNLVRNELDWRGVGAHKAKVLRARLREIAPNANIAVQIVNLGGQESSEWTATALETLSKCDLIIDATADATVFGLAAAAARFRGRAMIWAEIFSGGIGGIVARSRPGHDPSPDLARRQILTWCEDKNVEWEPLSIHVDYGVSRTDQPPLIADDADVSVIAGHLARLAIDTLRGGGSQFPAPAYAIGLAEGWIFTAPFDTHPITYTGTDGWVGGSSPDESKLKELVSLLFPEQDQDASCSV
ncbi:ThiF family adenylyltransferase [uncultured Agrobacterium sp.]|uniref:ThiF family adenylyltransferase n=1 Tax=uncultured Agrobacterium sp. TaxID=157277 RepID=UPI0025EE3993|nr:ThiF family adenylyltransferase [uncultured Agrobacterium sp.]